jgi:hypothetical protein
VTGQHLPADHTRGDASTVGGYAAVHARPAAFEGVDGASYSVDLLTDATGDPASPWGAYLFFVRWSAGTPALDGHLESDFLAWGPTESGARAALSRLPLADAKRTLDALIDAAGRAP